MEDFKPLSTPVQSSGEIRKGSCSLLYDIILCRGTVGALQYLSLTSLKIFIAVNQTCQHMHEHGEDYFHGLKYILCYILDTLYCDLQLLFDWPMRLVVHLNADWVGCPKTNWCITICCILRGTNLIFKKQTTVSCSIMRLNIIFFTEIQYEAQYHVIAAVDSDLSSLTNMLLELHLASSEPPRF